MLCLEKSWDVLHYLLTGSDEYADDLLDFLTSGGQEVGQDTGYGRPRLFNRDHVESLHLALAGITDDQFWGRFDAEEFEAMEIYPGNFSDEPEDELREGYVTDFHNLRDYIAHVAKSGGQLIVAIQ